MFIPLNDLRPGAVFVTDNGIVAVKTEYRYPNGAPRCVLLTSGEYAHFPYRGMTLVREIKVDASFDIE